MKLTYDEISPITGNKTVLIEYDDLHGTTKLCMESGYQHLERYVDGSQVCDDFELTCPQIIKQSKFVDGKNKVWYKLIIVTPTLILLPTATQWKIVGLRKMNVDEDITNSEVTLVSGDEVTVLDTMTELVFDKFQDAIDNFYKIIQQND